MEYTTCIKTYIQQTNIINGILWKSTCCTAAPFSCWLIVGFNWSSIILYLSSKTVGLNSEKNNWRTFDTFLHNQIKNVRKYKPFVTFFFLFNLWQRPWYFQVVCGWCLLLPHVPGIVTHVSARTRIHTHEYEGHNLWHTV